MGMGTMFYLVVGAFGCTCAIDIFLHKFCRNALIFPLQATNELEQPAMPDPGPEVNDGAVAAVESVSPSPNAQFPTNVTPIVSEIASTLASLRMVCCKNSRFSWFNDILITFLFFFSSFEFDFIFRKVLLPCFICVHKISETNPAFMLYYNLSKSNVNMLKMMRAYCSSWSYFSFGLGNLTLNAYWC